MDKYRITPPRITPPRITPPRMAPPRIAAHAGLAAGFAWLILSSAPAHAQPPASAQDSATRWQTTQVPAHDPVMIRQDSVYYVFFTGFGISVWSSVNRRDWRHEPPVFDKPPQWAVDAVPGFRGRETNVIWAPDISYHNGKFYLYYAVSA